MVRYRLAGLLAASRKYRSRLIRWWRSPGRGRGKPCRAPPYPFCQFRPVGRRQERGARAPLVNREVRQHPRTLCFERGRHHELFDDRDGCQRASEWMGFMSFQPTVCRTCSTSVEVASTPSERVTRDFAEGRTHPSTFRSVGARRLIPGCGECVGALIQPLIQAKSQAMANKVVYLTGAPAAGKSSICRALKPHVQKLAVFEYGARLTSFVSQKNSQPMDQSTLRARSSAVVTPEDVAAVDEELLQFVHNERTAKHVIIDSHAVTKESYGFRVTPYSLQKFAELSPSHIWVLYTMPDVALTRIERSPQGRPSITEEEARFHTSLQASVAVTYGMSLGIPIYFFDSDRPLDRLVEDLATRLAS